MDTFEVLTESSWVEWYMRNERMDVVQKVEFANGCRHLCRVNRLHGFGKKEKTRCCLCDTGAMCDICDAKVKR